MSSCDSLIAEKNRAHLRQLVARKIEYLIYHYPEGYPTLRIDLDIIQKGGSLTAAVVSLTNDAIILLAAYEDKEAISWANMLIDHIILLGEEALSRNCYGQQPVNSAKDYAIYVAQNRGMIYLRMSFALWFKYMEKPVHTFHEAVGAMREYYELRLDKKGERDFYLPSLFLSEEYEEYLLVYAKVVDIAINKPVVYNKWNVWKQISMYELSGDENLLTIENGVAYWYKRAQDWTRSVMDMSYDERIIWAYLYGQYITNESNIRKLLYNMKGY
jgi:hypothetical protein